MEEEKEETRTSEEKLAGWCEFEFGGKRFSGPVPVRRDMRKWRGKHLAFINHMKSLASVQSTDEAFADKFLEMMSTTDAIVEIVHAFAPWLPTEQEIEAIATEAEYYRAFSLMVAIANPHLAAAAAIQNAGGLLKMAAARTNGASEMATL